MQDKIKFMLLMLGQLTIFAIGWRLGEHRTLNKERRTISYISLVYRTKDSVWTIVPRTVVTNRSQVDAQIMADSIMIAQTLNIDSALHSGGRVRIGGDDVRKGIHIETIKIEQ